MFSMDSSQEKNGQNDHPTQGRGGTDFFFLNHSQLPKSPSEEGVWATFAILLILADLV